MFGVRCLIPASLSSRPKLTGLLNSPQAKRYKLTANSSIFIAAFSSLSMLNPHPSQLKIRSDNFKSFFTFLQQLHVFEDGKKLSITNNFEPYQSVLYPNCRRAS